MKLSLLLLLLSCTFSQAEVNKIAPHEPVLSSSLKLMGKGLVAADSKSMIALACYNDYCTQLRFVYFRNEKEAIFFGDTLNAPVSLDFKLMQEARKVLVKEFFYTHHTLYSAKRIDHNMKKNGELMLGGWTALFLAVPSLGTSLLGFGAGGAALTAAMCFFAGANEIEAVTSGMGTVATLDDQIGWNWAEKPKKISENAFNDLAKRIESGTHLVDFANQVFGTWDRDRRLEHRIARDKEKLQSKNVRFPENTWGFAN